MIKRFFTALGSFIKTSIGNIIETGSTSTSTTSSVSVLGPPAAVVTLTVVFIHNSNPGYFNKINGVVKNAGDTFTVTLDGTGLGSFNQTIDTGTSAPGNSIVVRCQITATSIGPIGTPNNYTLSGYQ
jgi:hypothetical protein